MKIALGIEYKGTDYSGWQSQTDPELPTIQRSLEESLSLVANHPVKIICAGRTDAGVHALNQVIHFETESIRPMHAWMFGSNRHLPKDISIQWACEVNENFHARFSALSRSYRYVIINKAAPPAINRDQMTWHIQKLDAYKMHQAAQYLSGGHDFSAFRASKCQAKNPVRHVFIIKVFRDGDKVIMEITANAFLHHMVRNIMGSLIAVGDGRMPVDDFKNILESRDRKQAGVTAPAAGLYLTGVCYPDVYDIPKVG